MAAPDRVYRLVEHFEREREAVRRPDYKEANLRLEFLDPLFESLGWDVRNEQGAPITEREVIIEEALMVARAHRAPDYGFYANRER